MSSFVSLKESSHIKVELAIGAREYRVSFSSSLGRVECLDFGRIPDKLRNLVLLLQEIAEAEELPQIVLSRSLALKELYCAATSTPEKNIAVSSEEVSPGKFVLKLNIASEDVKDSASIPIFSPLVEGDSDRVPVELRAHELDFITRARALDPKYETPMKTLLKGIAARHELRRFLSNEVVNDVLHELELFHSSLSPLTSISRKDESAGSEASELDKLNEDRARCYAGFKARIATLSAFSELMRRIHLPSGLSSRKNSAKLHGAVDGLRLAALIAHRREGHEVTASGEVAHEAALKFLNQKLFPLFEGEIAHMLEAQSDLYAQRSSRRSSERRLPLRRLAAVNRLIESVMKLGILAGISLLTPCTLPRRSIDESWDRTLVNKYYDQFGAYIEHSMKIVEAGEVCHEKTWREVRAACERSYRDPSRARGIRNPLELTRCLREFGSERLSRDEVDSSSGVTILLFASEGQLKRNKKGVRSAAKSKVLDVLSHLGSIHNLGLSYDSRSIHRAVLELPDSIFREALREYLDGIQEIIPTVFWMRDCWAEMIYHEFAKKAVRIAIAWSREQGEMHGATLLAAVGKSQTSLDEITSILEETIDATELREICSSYYETCSKVLRYLQGDQLELYELFSDLVNIKEASVVMTRGRVELLQVCEAIEEHLSEALTVMQERLVKREFIEKLKKLNRSYEVFKASITLLVRQIFTFEQFFDGQKFSLNLGEKLPSAPSACEIEELIESDTLNQYVELFGADLATREVLRSETRGGDYIASLTSEEVLSECEHSKRMGTPESRSSPMSDLEASSSRGISSDLSSGDSGASTRRFPSASPSGSPSGSPSSFSRTSLSHSPETLPADLHFLSERSHQRSYHDEEESKGEEEGKDGEASFPLGAISHRALRDRRLSPTLGAELCSSRELKAAKTLSEEGGATGGSGGSTPITTRRRMIWECQELLTEKQLKLTKIKKDRGEECSEGRESPTQSKILSNKLELDARALLKESVAAEVEGLLALRKPGIGSITDVSLLKGRIKALIHPARPSKVCRFLERHGFVLARQNGSHAIYKHSKESRAICIIPMHSKELSRGVLADIERNFYVAIAS